jgi:hypothetical protein
MTSPLLRLTTLMGAMDRGRARPLPGLRHRHEARWAAANLLRVATSVPAFGLLTWALVLCGRATA